jgi:ferritin-like protein
MENYFYIVTRLFYKGSEETHSVQIITDHRQATQRFYNIIAADLADNDVTYQFASIVDCRGNSVDGLRPVVYDRRPTPVE